MAERNAMIARTHALPVVRQCQLLTRARATADDQPTPGSEPERALMCRIAELQLQYPVAGARMLRERVRRAGHAIGRRHVAPLMRRMGLAAGYRKPHLSHRHPAHTVSPYLLRDLASSRPKHVWAAEITSLPMAWGFVYLCAVLDWARRRGLAWRLSNTRTTDFCLEAVQDARAN
jgi:putative transposase